MTKPGKDDPNTELQRDLPKSQSVVESLREQVELHKAARENSEERLAREWMWPKIAVVSISFVAGVFGVFAFWEHSLVISEISRRSENLNTELGNAQRTIQEMTQWAESEKDSFRQLRDQQKKELEIQKSEGLAEIEQTIGSELRQQIQRADTARQEALQAAAHSQRILTLISMGREQVFLKQNPSQGLAFANAAQKLYTESLSSGDAPPPTEFADVINEDQFGRSVLVAVYPTIWNLQLECLLQAEKYDELEKRSNEIIGSHTPSCVEQAIHCTLRRAFHYRALAKIERLGTFDSGKHPDLLSSSEHQSQKQTLTDEILSDLGAASGIGPDGSVSAIYQALILLNRGKFLLSKKALKPVLDQKDSTSMRSSETFVNVRIAETLEAVIGYLENPDHGLIDINCNLDPDALSKWDAHLLEGLIRSVIAKRSWLISEKAIEKTLPTGETATDDQLIRVQNTLATYCVDWILALRHACGSSGPNGECITCVAGNYQYESQNLAKAELLAQLQLRAFPGGPIYSTNKSLGEMIDGSLWLKVLDRGVVYEERIVSDTQLNGQTYHRTVTVPRLVPMPRFAKFSPQEDIPPLPYAKPSKEDIEKILNGRSPGQAPVEAPAPVPPAPILDAPTPE